MLDRVLYLLRRWKWFLLDSPSLVMRAITSNKPGYGKAHDKWLSLEPIDF